MIGTTKVSGIIYTYVDIYIYIHDVSWWLVDDWWLYECSNVWTSQIHKWILFPLSLSDFNTSGWIGWWESHRWLTFWRSNWNYSNFDNHLWDPNFELVRKKWQLLKMYIANSCRRVQGAMLYSCKLDVFCFFFRLSAGLSEQSLYQRHHPLESHLKRWECSAVQKSRFTVRIGGGMDKKS